MTRRGRKVFTWPCGTKFTVSLLKNGRQLKWYGGGGEGVVALSTLRQLVVDLRAAAVNDHERGEYVWSLNNRWKYVWPLDNWRVWGEPSWADVWQRRREAADLVSRVLRYANKLRREREQAATTA